MLDHITPSDMGPADHAQNGRVHCVGPDPAA